MFSNPAACDGLISCNTLPILKNTPDKQVIPKEALRLPTCSSKDSLHKSLQMSLNPLMQLDIMIPNRKPSRLPRPSSSLTQLFQLKEPKLLQAAIEAEEMHLHTHCHLLEEMHCIALSSVRTTEAATIEETIGAITNDTEGNNSSNSSVRMAHALPSEMSAASLFCLSLSADPHPHRA